MPRRARLSIPRVPSHIIQRGDNDAVCFSRRTGLSVLFALPKRIRRTARLRRACLHPHDQPRAPSAHAEPI